MQALNLPRPAWMTEDLALLEDQPVSGWKISGKRIASGHHDMMESQLAVLRQRMMPPSQHAAFSQQTQEQRFAAATANRCLQADSQAALR